MQTPSVSVRTGNHLDIDRARSLLLFPKPNGSVSLSAPGAAQGHKAEASSSSRADPVYRTRLPPGDYRKPVFSENDVPLNTALFTHSPENTVAGKAIVRALVKANPDIKILLLVPSIPESVERTRRELAEVYGVSESNIAPVAAGEGRVIDSNGPISLFPQDGFLAGASGLITQEADLRHGRRLASIVGGALGLPVRRSSGVGMGGDTKFVTRPDGKQAAYFGPETVGYAADALNKAGRSPSLDVRRDEDRLIVIGHIMGKMADFGVAADRVMPVGTGPRTYGDVLKGLSPDQRARIAPAILQRFESLEDLPFPSEEASVAVAYRYHTDLLMASPDGVRMFVNSDDATALPGHMRTLEAFGYKPVPLPSFYKRDPADPDYTIRLSYTNVVMGRLPNGKMAILLPSETVDPDVPTKHDEAALAIVRREFPEAEVSLIGGKTAIMDREVDWGPHCRTNVLPFLIEEAPSAMSAKEPAGAATRPGLF